MTIFKYKRDGMLYTIEYEYLPVTGRKIARPYNWQGRDLVLNCAKERDMIPVGHR